MKPLSQSRMTWMKTALVLALTAFSVGFAVGCGKKKSSPAAAPPPPPPPPQSQQYVCPNCPGNQTPLNSALGYSSIQEMELGLQFLGDGAMLGPQQQGGYSMPYSGPVMATGFLRVRVPDSINPQCGLPPGDYMVNTLQAGVWNNKSLGGLVLEAVGPTRLMISLPNNFIYDNGRAIQASNGSTFPFHLANYIQVQLPNGAGCYTSVYSFFLE